MDEARLTEKLQPPQISTESPNREEENIFALLVNNIEDLLTIKYLNDPKRLNSDLTSLQKYITAYHLTVTTEKNKITQILVKWKESLKKPEKEKIKKPATKEIGYHLAKPLKPVKTIILISGNFTGDAASVAGTVMCDDNLFVLVLKEVTLQDPALPGTYVLSIPHTLAKHFGIENQNELQRYTATASGGRCKSAEIESLLQFSLKDSGASKRVFILPTSNITKTYSCLTQPHKSEKEEPFSVDFMHYLHTHSTNRAGENFYEIGIGISSLLKIQPVEKGTKFLGAKDRDTVIKVIREKWILHDNKVLTNAISSLLIKQLKIGSSFPVGRYIVIWSRFSSKHKGGAHAQHDTGYEAVRQLIELAHKNNLHIILAGDKGDITRDNRYTTAEIHQRREKTDTLSQKNVALDLREIWLQAAFQEIKNEFGIDNRILQLNFFDYLDQNAGFLFHIGMRSGSLEAYTLIGHYVNYIEEDGNLQSQRLESWNSSSSSKTTDPGHSGKLAYNKVPVYFPPTVTGKYMQDEVISKPQQNDNEFSWGPKVLPLLDPLQRKKAKNTALQEKHPIIKQKGFVPVDETRLEKVIIHMSTVSINKKNGYSEWNDRSFSKVLSPLRTRSSILQQFEEQSTKPGAGDHTNFSEAATPTVLLDNNQEETVDADIAQDVQEFPCDKSASIISKSKGPGMFQAYSTSSLNGVLPTSMENAASPTAGLNNNLSSLSLIASSHAADNEVELTNDTIFTNELI